MRMRGGALVAGLAASVLLTAFLWRIGFPGFFLFLFLPFLFRWPRQQAPMRRCAACGFATDDPDARFCPRDGSPLA
jgi:hypothetical protein